MLCLSGIFFTSIIHIHSWPGPYFYSHILEYFRVIFCFRGEKFDCKEQVVPVEAASTVVVTALDVFALSCSNTHLCCIRLCRTQLWTAPDWAAPS